jgi:hypothetical protein
VGFADAIRKTFESVREDVRQAKAATPQGGFAQGGRSGQGQQQQEPWHAVPSLARELDPYPWLLSIHAGYRHMHHKLFMGTDGRDFIYIGFLAPLWTWRRQTFADMIANTAVLKEPEPIKLMFAPSGSQRRTL